MNVPTIIAGDLETDLWAGTSSHALSERDHKHPGWATDLVRKPFETPKPFTLEPDIHVNLHYFRTQIIILARNMIDLTKQEWPISSAQELYFEPLAHTATQKDDDLEWFASVSDTLDEFRGQYVAIHDKKIIGSGKTTLDALNRAKVAKPEAKPLIAYIPKSARSAL